MKTRALLLSGLLTGIVLLITGCGSSKSNSVGGSGTVVTCQAGQAYVPQFNGCYAIGNCAPGYAFVPSANGCYPTTTTPVTPGVGTRHKWRGQLNVADVGVYRRLLKDFGVCDAYMWNFGYADCDNWPGRADILVEAYGGTLPAQGSITLAAYSSSSWYGATTLLPFFNIFKAATNNTQVAFWANGQWTGYNRELRATIQSPAFVANNQAIQQLQLDVKYGLPNDLNQGLGQMGTAVVYYNLY